MVFLTEYVALMVGFVTTVKGKETGVPVPTVILTLVAPRAVVLNVLKEAFTITDVVKLHGFLTGPKFVFKVKLSADLETTVYQGGTYPKQDASLKSKRTGRIPKKMNHSLLNPDQK